jgi:hypothetical protein
MDRRVKPAKTRQWVTFSVTLRWISHHYGDKILPSLRERPVPNRFQLELARKDGVIAGRRWSCQRARGRRVPVELHPVGGESLGFSKNDILATREQRAFAVLDSAGAWRRLAAEYLANGDHERAGACKRAAHEHLFSAVRARLEAEPADYLMAAE